jgi:hypothetical protein
LRSRFAIAKLLIKSPTDPVLQEQCYPELPERGEPERRVEITLGGPTYICISLTPPWRGKQYKIAAGFVRLEH